MPRICRANLVAIFLAQLHRPGAVALHFVANHDLLLKYGACHLPRSGLLLAAMSPMPKSVLKASQMKTELRAARARSVLFTRPGFVIRRLHQIHTGLFLAEAGAFNITPVQYSLLTTLVEHEEIDQNSLCLEIGLERTSVSEVLPRLEARGLLSRKPSTTDRRVKLGPVNTNHAVHPRRAQS